MSVEEGRRAEDGGRRKDRSVRLPFAFGERVYHRARSEKVPGIVTGFQVHPNELQVYVRWGDDLSLCTHFFFELTTEFSPFTEDSSNADH